MPGQTQDADPLRTETETTGEVAAQTRHDGNLRGTENAYSGYGNTVPAADCNGHTGKGTQTRFTDSGFLLYP